MQPITILGKIVVPDELIRCNRDLLPVEYTNFRMPNDQADLACCGAEKWHQDNFGCLTATTYGLMVWSNMHPTEVLLPNGDIVSGEPNEVVLIDNQVCKHRVPPALLAKVKMAWSTRNYPQRYFTRAHINYPITDENIEEWRERVIQKQHSLRNSY